MADDAPAEKSAPPAAPTEAPIASSSQAESTGPDAAEKPQATIGADAVTQTWAERTRERKNELQALREKEKATLGAVQRRGAKERLAYLMKQTDVFAHFIKPDEAGGGGGGGDKAKGAGSGAGAGRRKKGRMTEKQEDELLLKQAEAASSASGGAVGQTRLTKQPACIAHGTMRPYQLEGLNWLIKLHENGINGILADEMGLGKTLQSISLLAFLKESKGISGPHLVIAPKSTISNWQREAERWCPSLASFKFCGDKHERAALKAKYLDFGTGFNLCITTYEVAISEKAALSKLVWRYLIIDEAHRIKNEASVLSKVVRLFTAHFRLLVTGTPLQNNLHELWAMLNFLLPDIFDDSSQFDDWFSLTDNDAEDVLSQLHRILRPFLLRRLKADVEKNLPPKREIKLHIGMSEMQRTWYGSILTKNIDVINAMGGSRAQMHNILMHLRKCANHPYLFEGAEQPPFVNDERLIRHSGKMLLLDKLLRKLHAGGHRVLVFSQMTRMLDILEDYCWLRDWEYCRIDGSTSGDLRDEAMEVFNAPQSAKFLFMLSTRAGGLGINLATADTVILFDSDWNPQADLQAMDRAHRIGQTKPVVVYRFMVEGTVEEKIIERAQKKLYLDAAVIQQGRLAETAKALSKDEMLSMIRFGADAVFQSKGTDEYTDADIDALIKRGEERTRLDDERFQQTANSLANFSLGGEEKNMYEFDGEDFSGQKVRSENWSLTLPKRQHKLAVQENGRGGERRPRGEPNRRETFDFQFFDTVRLDELNEKELRYWQWSQQAKARRRKSASSSKADGADHDFELEEEDLGDPPQQLTEAEEDEKQGLLAAGFGSWTKKDLASFVRGCEQHGRNDLAAVAAEVDGKSEREVARYAVTFFQRFAELKEWEKMMRRIEQGEARIQRRLDMGSAFQKKCARHTHPFLVMKIDYGNGSTKGKQYTEEEDRFLVCMTNQLGYGNWEELAQEVRKAWSLRFDWWIRTRTPQELGQRVEVLSKLVEREVLEWEAEARELDRLERQRRKAAKKAEAKRAAEQRLSPYAKRQC